MAATPRQPETAASAVQPAHPETGEQERPKRLPGLWIICVVIGVCGMFWVSMLFLATPLGVVLFGAVALLHFAVAVGLWRRLNFVRIVLMVLLGIACILLAVGWATDPLDNIVAAVPFSVSVTVIAYLWFRRRPFKLARELKPRLGSASVAVAGVMVLVLGMGWILVLTVDDGLEHFPQLEIHRVPVSDEENAFVVLQEMMELFPLGEDDDLDWVLDGYLAEESLDPGEWDARAAEVVHRWEECLQRADDLLARPHFAPPWPTNYADMINMNQDGLWYCRRLAQLLSVQSGRQLAEAQPKEAINTAWKTVDLGLMLSGADHGLMTYLAGISVFTIGIEQVRVAAGSSEVTSGLILPQKERLELSARLTQSFMRMLARELDFTRMGFESLMRLDWLEEVLPANELGWGHKLLKRPPLLKLNMTLNLLGGYLTEIVDGLDRYSPAQPEPDHTWRGGTIAEVGLVHYLRNPIGDILVLMLQPAHQRLQVEHFRLVANARVTQVFLALRCYHLDNGRLPEELAELAPEYFDQVPVDPFTEKAFRYEPDAAPPRMYSVGPNQKLDGPDAEERDDLTVELLFAAP